MMVAVIAVGVLPGHLALLGLKSLKVAATIVGTVLKAGRLYRQSPVLLAVYPVRCLLNPLVDGLFYVTTVSEILAKGALHLSVVHENARLGLRVNPTFLAVSLI